jgi:hypothetical protein
MNIYSLKKNSFKNPDGGFAVSSPNKLVRGNNNGIIDPNWLAPGSTNVNKVLRGDSSWGSIESGINYITNSNAESDTTGWNLYNDAVTAAELDDMIAVSGNAVSTKTPHGLSFNDVVVLSESFDALSAYTRYYVASVPSSTSFTLKASRTGSVIALVGTPAGTEDVFNYSVTAGSGGSSTLSFINSASNPLRGIKSFHLVKGASYLGGQGVSTNFTVATADLGKLLNITFEHMLVSGTLNPNDIEVWIYDVDNTSLIQPVGFEFDGSVSTSAGIFKATFQSVTSSANYRLIIHNVNPSNTAYTLALDSIKVTPEPIGFITPVTDWEDFTPVFTGVTIGNGQTIFKKRRVGDTLQIEGRFAWGTTTSGTSNALLQLPDSLNIDTTKISTSFLGHCSVDNLITSPDYLVQPGTSYYNSANSVYFTVSSQDVTSKILSQTALVWDSNGSPFDGRAWTTDDVLGVSLQIPILGWGSNTLVSSIDDGRDIVATVSLNTPQTLLTTVIQTIAYDTVEVDTHNAYNPTNGYFTVPVAGYYEVSGVAGLTTGTSASIAQIWMYKNATQYVQGWDAGDVVDTLESKSFSTTIKCEVGDLLHVAAIVTAGGVPAVAGTNIYNRITFKKVTSGSKTILPSEKAISLVSLSTPQALADNTETVIEFDNVISDTLSMYKLATDEFIIPEPGIYEVAGIFTLTGGTGTTLIWVNWTKNGTEISKLGQSLISQDDFTCSFNDAMSFEKGDVVTFKSKTDNTGGSASISVAKVTLKRL